MMVVPSSADRSFVQALAVRGEVELFALART